MHCAPRAGRRAFSNSAPPDLSSLRRWGWATASYNPLRPPPPPHPPSPYTGALGFEFEHLDSAEERAWWAAQIESPAVAAFSLPPPDLKRYHRLLASAEAFEAFLSRKLATLKRYGGEGCEGQLPALHTLLACSAEAGARAAVVSSAHRGRLATQVALLRYPARKLFWKLRGFDDIPLSVPGCDDVSSHIAVSADLLLGRPWGSELGAGGGGRSGGGATGTGTLHVSLLPNPSHLEAVNPVAAGKVRAKQDGARSPSSAVAVVVHGDAAVAGQGVVYETGALARSPGYDVGGTLHLICNNQIGFTLPAGARAGAFARGMDAPVLHVSAEAPRELVLACRLASAYREKFRKDVVVDMVGYRRNGHNEVDEPAFTSPQLYAQIRAKKPHAAALGEELEAAGVLQQGETARLSASLAATLEAEWTASAPGGAAGFTPSSGCMAGGSVAADGAAFAGAWAGFRPPAAAEVGACPPTGVEVALLRAIGASSTALPQGFPLHPRLLRGFAEPRREALTAPSDKRTIDWATAEALAFGSLLSEGLSVRLAGQDSERGTFSHRHAVLHAQDGSGTAVPLAAVAAQAGGQFTVVSSPLTEFAAMGFELGYSWETPRQLVVWEAQFGDFANCAQVIIDQFLSGGESKWLRQTGLVLLLPHGQDGAGPEHSSARIERFLQLCNSQAWAGEGGGWGDDKTAVEPLNMIIANPTTPYNYFHVMRRQCSPLRPFRKPLVLIAPKALLRAQAALSALDDFAPGTMFLPVLGECSAREALLPGCAAPPQHLVICSGKVYYELIAKRAELVAAGSGRAAATRLIRVEQLCPWPTTELEGAISAALDGGGQCESGLESVRWVQEEPANAGAWAWAAAHLPRLVRGAPVTYVGRPALAAPAVGLSLASKAQQDRLLTAAFA